MKVEVEFLELNMLDPLLLKMLELNFLEGCDSSLAERL